MSRRCFFSRFSSRTKTIVITGFNTDIEFEGVTYHVQTEDKGALTPMIMTLVYNRGTILASKRTSYADLVEADQADEKVLSERLQKQHRLICAAVKFGRIEDLKKMTARESETAKSQTVSAATASHMPANPPVFDGKTGQRILDKASRPDAIEAIPKPFLDVTFEMPPALPVDSSKPAENILDRDILFPDDAVEIVGGLAGLERPVNYKLNIEILGDIGFKGGDRKLVTIMVCRGTDRKVVSNAQVLVKVIGSSFRPFIFHSLTDSNGLAQIDIQLPNFTSGRSAFLIRAMAFGEEVELRRPIAHG